jgi:hypothetical protein
MTDEGLRKPRKLPLRDIYDMYDDSFIPSGLYRLLDVDVVERPSGRATLRRQGQPDKIIYVDPETNEEISGPTLRTHTEVWGRLENLKSFGAQ